MKKASLGQRLRYAFDNTMANGPVALIAWLGVLSLGVIAVATAVVIALRISPADAAETPGPHEVAWMSLMRTLDPGTMGGDEGWAFRVVMLLVTLGGVFIVSTLIGVVITGMEAKIEQLRKGRSFVMERRHTLILGWSSKIHTIISELTIANENQKKPRIVVLADKDKAEMEDEIRDKVGIRRPSKPPARPERILLLGWNHRASTIVRELNGYVAPGSVVKVVANASIPQPKVAAFAASLKNLTLEFQQGDTTNRALLDRLDVRSFDHIILLCYEQALDPQEADAQTLITLLHLRDISDRGGTQLNIVSEMLDMRNRELAEVTKADDFIVSDKLISLLMSQVSENKYLMRVFEDLFDADGSEVYLKPISNYVETGAPVNFYTVLESARRRGEVAIGYRIVSLAHDVSKAYGVKVNPVKGDMVTFAAGDRVIVIAED